MISKSPPFGRLLEPESLKILILGGSKKQVGYKGPAQAQRHSEKKQTGVFGAPRKFSRAENEPKGGQVPSHGGDFLGSWLKSENSGFASVKPSVSRFRGTRMTTCGLHFGVFWGTKTGPGAEARWKIAKRFFFEPPENFPEQKTSQKEVKCHLIVVISLDQGGKVKIVVSL